MRIEHLAEFADLAETLSFTETAQRVLLSESALSRHIKGLEDELGLELFERTSRRVRLSAEGQRLLPFAKAMNETWQTYVGELRAARSQARSSVSIGANYYVGDLIAQFCAEHPDISVRQPSQGDSTAQLLEMLVAGECQLVVVIDPPELDEHIGTLDLGIDSYVAVLPAQHPRAGQEVIDPAGLAGDHIISFRFDSDGDRRIKAICKAAGFEPNIIFSAEVGSSIAQFVRDGLGVTFLQKKTIAKMMTEGVAYVDLEPPVEIRAVLCWDRRVPPAPAVTAFLGFVRSQL